MKMGRKLLHMTMFVKTVTTSLPDMSTLSLLSRNIRSTQCSACCAGRQKTPSVCYQTTPDSLHHFFRPPTSTDPQFLDRLSLDHRGSNSFYHTMQSFYVYGTTRTTLYQPVGRVLTLFGVLMVHEAFSYATGLNNSECHLPCTVNKKICFTFLTSMMYYIRCCKVRMI